MIEADIRRLLAFAADDQDAPAATPAWLRVERARSYRRRQRQVGCTAVLGIASTVAGIAISLGSAERSAAHPSTAAGGAGGSISASSQSSSASGPRSTDRVAAPLLVVRTETRTVAGQPQLMVLTRTTVLTTSVPGPLRTMSVHDTVTDTRTDTHTQTDTQTQTVTTTVNHTVHQTVTVTPPPRTVTVTVTETPSPTGPQVP